MGVLSTQLRCKRCGAKVPNRETPQCWSCRADLAEVGLWSELQEWTKTRQMGRKRFIWRRGVLGWGGVFALAMGLPYLFQGQPLVVFAWIVPYCLIAGFFLGKSYWRDAESEYSAAAEEHDRTSRSVGTGQR
jgi:fatty acid desaturase